MFDATRSVPPEMVPFGTPYWLKVKVVAVGVETVVNVPSKALLVVVPRGISITPPLMRLWLARVVQVTTPETREQPLILCDWIPIVDAALVIIPAALHAVRPSAKSSSAMQ